MAAWDEQTIKDAVEQTESSCAGLVSAMRTYERAWRLEFWSGAEREQARIEGRKLYTSPQPRNVVSLANNLIAGRVKISCPAYEETAEEVENANQRARFLELLIQRQAKTLEMGIVDALGWYALVRGRMAMQVVWVYDMLSPNLRLFQPPILYRPLDPIGVGVERDHTGTRWAYHKYREKIAVTKSRYPDIFKDELVKSDPKADKEVEITDFWYVDDKGKVWNAVLVEETFAKKPKKTQYPCIPIFERNNDPTPATDERWRSGSILEGSLETWAELNFLHSMHLTAVGRYFWPAIYYTNAGDEDVAPLDTGMGAVNELPPGTQFMQPPGDKPDVALATSAVEVLNTYEQESTFPDVLYGDAGQMRAAYGMNMMASTAVRRIRSTKEQMQILLEGANELALWCVHKYAPSGVNLYGYDKADKKATSVSLSAEQVSSRFDNSVDIEASVPGAQLQEMITGIQLVNNKIISRDTFRRTWIPADKETPPDEDTRVLIERIEDDPDLLRQRLRDAYRDYYGEELPPGEPDFQATPQQQPRPVQPMPQQPMPPPQQAPMGPPGYLPQPGMGGPEFQGGVSPDMMGMEQGSPDTQALMAMIQNGMIPGPQDQANMIQNRFRRR